MLPAINGGFDTFMSMGSPTKSATHLVSVAVLEDAETTRIWDALAAIDANSALPNRFAEADATRIPTIVAKPLATQPNGLARRLKKKQTGK